MKNSWINDLDHQLKGTVTNSSDVLDYYSTDGSIFTMRPTAAVYPKNTEDVQTTVRFVNELAEKGQNVSIVPRGKGTDQGGGAVGTGIMMVFPAHMKQLMVLGRKSVTVQPGLLYRDLQNTLETHNRFLPPYPSSIDFSTIGGAIANNACGEKTIKYGSTRDFVQSLDVVLSSGDLIKAGRISKGELNRKKGLATFEGELYRKLDSLLIDNARLIREAAPKTSKNTAGYALWEVKDKDGSFDLSKLIVGSQGTLGIVTGATLKTEPYNPGTTLVVGYFDSLEKAGQAVMKLEGLKPSALEVVDYYLLDFLQKNRPGSLDGLVPEGKLPKIVLLVEFDDFSKLRQQVKSRRTMRILKKLSTHQKVTNKHSQQEALWKIRRSAAAVIWMNKGSQKALPIIEDGVVPVTQLPQFLNGVYKLMKKYKLTFAVWGHAGDANFHMQPFMDLGKNADRAKIFDLAEEFYSLVIGLGGSTCGEHNDGLSRAPYLKKLYGKEMFMLFQGVKQIFDPKGIFNPGKKADGVTVEGNKKLLRKEYSMKHLYDHMPYS